MKIICVWVREVTRVEADKSLYIVVYSFLFNVSLLVQGGGTRDFIVRRCINIVAPAILQLVFNKVTELSLTDNLQS